MKAVEGDAGQDADELADYLGRQTFPDGTNMLAMMHNDNYIKKFKTKEIMVTFGNTADGRILLNKLNEMIAKEKGVKVADLQKDPDAKIKLQIEKQQRKLMPKKQPPKNSTWVQLTKDFVSEWPEVLEGLQFQNMPVRYLRFVNITLKNNVTIHYNIEKELKVRRNELGIARFLKQTLEQHYTKIKNIDLKFYVIDYPKDMESRNFCVNAKNF